MPRSGTSLVEQILASHPDCFGAGELPNLGLLTRSLGGRAPTPIESGSSSRKNLRHWARAYLESLPADSAGAARVTDKMPANYLHLGLAAAILPRARAIWCRRDAMDVCFSIYAQQFTHQDAYPYAFDLEDVASEYLACERLMNHWTRTLPIPLHEVRYERLVEDPEGVTTSLLEFCGLPFDARCLRFHETDRRVGTASNWQVRQPLYSDLARPLAAIRAAARALADRARACGMSSAGAAAAADIEGAQASPWACATPMASRRSPAASHCRPLRPCSTT